MLERSRGVPRGSPSYAADNPREGVRPFGECAVCDGGGCRACDYRGITARLEDEKC